MDNGHNIYCANKADGTSIERCELSELNDNINTELSLYPTLLSTLCWLTNKDQILEKIEIFNLKESLFFQKYS